MPRPENPAPMIATRTCGTRRPPSLSWRTSPRDGSMIVMRCASSGVPREHDAEVVEDLVFERVREDVQVALETGDHVLALHGDRLVAALGQVLQPRPAGVAERLPLVAELDDLEQALGRLHQLVRVRDVAALELLALQELQVVDELAVQRRG